MSAIGIIYAVLGALYLSYQFGYQSGLRNAQRDLMQDYETFSKALAEWRAGKVGR